MRAARLTSWQTRPALVDVPVPEPGPGEVLLAVTAAGICHSDLHVMAVGPGVLPYELPFTLGHEAAGRVAAVGPGVTGLDTGAAVVVHGIWSCGHCRRCAAGRENYCLAPPGAVGNGLGRDGALADYLLVPDQRHLVSAEGLDPVVAAPLTDAGLTSLHAVNRSLDRLDAGAVVLVLGVGGLGHLAVQVLRALTEATVVAVDTRAAARDLGLASGAQHVAAPDDVAGLVAELTGGTGVDVAFDFVGSDGTLRLAAATLAPGGDLTVVGSGGGVLPVGKSGQVPRGTRLSLPFWGTRAELAVVLDLARDGLLRPHVQTWGLSEVVQAYDALAAGEVLGRAVVVP